MPNTILTLDLAIKTGWAVMAPGWRKPESGVQTFALNRGESPGMRFLRFRRWLEEVVRLYAPDLIVYEQTHHRGGPATEIAVGFATRAQEVAAELGAEHVAVHTATLKKHATGSGRAGDPIVCVWEPSTYTVDGQETEVSAYEVYARQVSRIGPCGRPQGLRIE